MSKYFISVYKNYLNKIESDKTLETKYKALKDKMTLFNTSFNNYVDSIDNSTWNELGKDQIVSLYISKVRNSKNILLGGVLNNMDKVITLIKNDLYKLLLELKEKDDEYCEMQNNIKLDEQDVFKLEYSKEKLKVMDEILLNLVKNIDNKIIEIKKYNDLDDSVNGNFLELEKININATKEALLSLYSKAYRSKDDDSIIGKLKAQIEENRLKKLFDGNSIIDDSEIEYIEEEIPDEVNTDFDSSNCIDLSLLNENWKVINTELPVSEYASIAYNKGIRQNSNPEKYGDYCLAFSYVHASNLYNGVVDDSAECAYKWQHASEFNDFFCDDKQETLKMVYNQIVEGKPVIMQVNGNSSGTVRHFVTVVGVKSDVKKDTISESDLLILDSWDGKLESMDTEYSRFMTTGKETNKDYSGYYLRILK